MEKVPRCAIYIRVSSAEQVMHGKSLEAQLKFLTEYAQNKGFKLIGHFADEGKTARKELKRRKAIKELLECVKRDEVDVILFWKMDRWFRNVADFYKVQDILDAHNCRWIAAAEPSMNLDSREGRLNVNIMLSINQNETDTTSERIRFVNEASVKQGKAIFGDSSLPFGYRLEHVDGVKRIVKDPDTQHIVEDFFSYYLKHQTKQGTLKYLVKKYGDVLTINSVLKMCSHTFYYGAYRGNEQYCPAYITKEQWETMQEINKRNIKEKHDMLENAEPNVFLFSGLFVCPLCGRRLGAAKRIRENGTIYRYYRCINHYTNASCTYGKVINESVAEKYLLDNLSRLYALQKNIFIDTVLDKKPVTRQETDISKYQKELDRLNTMFQKGRISEEKYDQEYERLSSAISQSRTIQIDTAKAERTFQKLDSVLSNSSWQELYENLTRENRRAFWRGMIHSIDCNVDHGTIREVHFMP